MNTDPQTARLGLMKFIAKKGGEISMRDLHTHSLVFFQAGHQEFSQLMESLVGDGLVTFADASSTFALSGKGRTALAENA